MLSWTTAYNHGYDKGVGIVGKDETLNFKRREAAARSVAMGLTTGAIQVQDRFGRGVRPGDLVLFHPEQDILYQVDSITPVMDPAAQPGLVTLQMTARVPVYAMAGQPVLNMVFIDHTTQRMASESGAEGTVPVGGASPGSSDEAGGAPPAHSGTAGDSEG